MWRSFSLRNGLGLDLLTCPFSSAKVTFQYVLWDHFKALGSLTPANRSNLCRLCSHLITSRALSLAILRVGTPLHACLCKPTLLPVSWYKPTPEC